MKTALSLLALVLFACALPRTASAQCDDGCARLIRNDGGTAGWGCAYVEGSGQVCSATRTQCVLTRCSTAYLTTPDGRFVEMRNGCDKPETLPARVASALGLASSRISALLEQRARMTVAASRPAGAGPG